MDDLKTSWVFRNYYPNKKGRQMKKHSSKVFKSLEEVMSKYDNVKLVSKTYKFGAKGKLVYSIIKRDDEVGRLNIDFFSGYVLGKGSSGFNTLSVELLAADRSKVNIRFISDLESKFYTFSEEQKK